MDLTQGTPEEKQARSKKMMLWFGIGSLIMSFAAWTSAFIVSSKREDWLTDFQLPPAFFISLIIIIVSSITLILAKRMLLKDKNQLVMLFMLVTFGLGIMFITFQIQGFDQIIADGYNFTGPTSNITMSYVFLIAAVHIAHVAVGLICLLVVIYNHFKKKYSSSNTLGFELASNFWHFVDLLWVYLFLFLYFFRYII